MDITIVLIFLSSGLFLGWSLGANDASNVFGTAVGSKMIKFSTAAIICSIFVILGAVIGGAGAAHGLGALGAVNALPGSFICAFAAALTVFWMTKLGLPVSTTQAVVGSIIGWNLFSGSVTDIGAVTKILLTWIACPILGAVFGALLYKLVTAIIRRTKPHLLHLDLYTRIALVVVGAAGAYSLGANNIGNVMGVFVSSSPFTDFEVADLFTLSSEQQLFLLGAIAIAVGVITYSKRVMMTVGNSLLPMSPVGAFAAVSAHSLVLFIFSSSELQRLMVSAGLPPIPLIPVSSSQAVVGAIIGIGLARGLKSARQIKWGVLLNISSGWVSTPIIGAIVCFFSLFVMQNVFNQPVYQQVYFALSEPVMMHLEKSGLPVEQLSALKDQRIAGGIAFREAVRARVELSEQQASRILAAAEIYDTYIDPEKLAVLDREFLSTEQVAALDRLIGESFEHKWQLHDALVEQSEAWKKKEDDVLNKDFNKALHAQLDYVYNTFHVDEVRRKVPQ